MKAGNSVDFGSPGFASTRMDGKGRLIEDWGSLGVRLTGDGIPAAPPVTVAEARIEGLIPAARATSQCGPVSVTATAYRAPAFPAGFDVGARTVSLAGRVVASLPFQPVVDADMREWGYMDEATSMPGWAQPAVPCDPAFRNIRAGMGGVPIVYRFPVPAKGAADVVLGFCESFWAQPGKRPMIPSKNRVSCPFLRSIMAR